VTDKIGVSLLKNIGVLYEGDIYDLALLLLKVNDAKDRGTNSKSRHTINGVAKSYSMLANVDLKRVMAVITRHGLPLGAVVEHDEDVVSHPPLKPGDKVIWWKRIPGGDYVYPVAAVVIATTAKRIKIEGDDDGQTVVRYVPPESLQRR